jgi:selenide,water dikinase
LQEEFCKQKEKQKMPEEIKLTQFSHGAGCGCKIAPQVLDEILKSNFTRPDNKKLLVGNNSKDDAAAYDLGNGQALISTTDFFMPIVDDPFDFGRIASANAISDIYAMGGTPVLAIALLGWPINKIPAEVAQKVIEGSRSVCAEAGIPLAGGHSIDTIEPMFGLAVNGLAKISHLKKNNTAKQGDLLFLTKRLGVGILSTAQKRAALTPEHLELMVKQMITLNKVGQALGEIDGVSAMTDVTGFGLMGHLIEMAEGSGISAEISYQNLLFLNGVSGYLEQKCIPGGTVRNWSSYGHKARFEEDLDEALVINTLSDPQTNGGLLIAVNEHAVGAVIDVLKDFHLHPFLTPVGKMIASEEKTVIVKSRRLSYIN